MNGDNPHLTGPLLQLCTRGLIYDGEKNRQ